MDGATAVTHVDLGARVLAAARMAVAMHLYEAATPTANGRRRYTIGGADPARAVVTEDDAPPTAAADLAAHPGAARPPRIEE